MPCPPLPVTSCVSGLWTLLHVNRSPCLLFPFYLPTCYAPFVQSLVLSPLIGRRWSIKKEIRTHACCSSRSAGWMVSLLALGFLGPVVQLPQSISNGFLCCRITMFSSILHKSFKNAIFVSWLQCSKNFGCFLIKWMMLKFLRAILKAL